MAASFASASPPDKLINPLWRAALFSILIHAALLFWWKLPSNPANRGGNLPLTVYIKPSVADSNASVPAPMADSINAAVATVISKKVPSVKIVPQQESTASTIEAKTTPPAGGDRQPNLEKGGASLTMVVDAKGHIHDLIWQELPAMTTEQFTELERRIREEKRLATGRTHSLRQTINIKQYLVR